MSTPKLYAIMDLKGSTYGNVFDAVSDADAVRVFDSFVLSENTPYYQYCEDFALVSICSFDPASGNCSDFGTRLIASAIQRRIEHEASQKFFGLRVDHKVTELKAASSFAQMESEKINSTPSDPLETFGSFHGDL